MISSECPTPEPRQLSRGAMLFRQIAALGLFVLWIAALAIVARLVRKEDWDVGMKVGISSLVIAVALLVSFLWFVTLAPVSRSLRLGVGGVCLVLGIVLASVLRLEGVDGSLTPKFALRWAPKADSQLAEPEIQPGVSQVDLA
ncbi:MAG: hypothetical protein KDA92_18355, partial [Planctomycetales bacterium]|nr:hypothetical protein [Planctomycetales bacterium]